LKYTSSKGPAAAGDVARAGLLQHGLLLQPGALCHSTVDRYCIVATFSCGLEGKHLLHHLLSFLSVISLASAQLSPKLSEHAAVPAAAVQCQVCQPLVLR
jgi:hypothetical protein